MNPSEKESDDTSETFQEYPLQTFTCKAIRVTPDMVLTPRLGRPDRDYKELLKDRNENGDTRPAQETPPSDSPPGKA
jgi:hypothetical protein